MKQSKFEIRFGNFGDMFGSTRVMSYLDAKFQQKKTEIPELSVLLHRVGDIIKSVSVFAPT